MFTFDLIQQSRIKHEELIADAAKWSGRAYGFYPSLDEARTENRILVALKSLFTSFASNKSKPASDTKPVSGIGSLRTATK